MVFPETQSRIPRPDHASTTAFLLVGRMNLKPRKPGVDILHRPCRQTRTKHDFGSDGSQKQNSISDSDVSWLEAPSVFTARSAVLGACRVGRPIRGKSFHLTPSYNLEPGRLLARFSSTPPTHDAGARLAARPRRLAAGFSFPHRPPRLMPRRAGPSTNSPRRCAPCLDCPSAVG